MSDKKSLSSEYQQVLQDQVINEDGPGTILRDFEIVLDFIGSEGIMVSGKTNLLLLKVLAELNSRLTHPIEIDLKRPQQKSYPNIHGLYLLLRASGLSMIRGSGKKSRLMVDKAIESWRSLNPTERYFNLLGTWLVHGSPEVLAERMGGSFRWMPECKRFWKRIPKHGLKIAGNKDEEMFVTYSIGFFGLALLELFGFITLEHLKPEKGKGWRIGRACRTTFGDALLALLWSMFCGDLGDSFFFSQAMNDTCDSFQPVIKPLFPEWHNNLIVPEPMFQDGTYIFKISLARNCWRRIAISSHMDLESLSVTILDAFNFDHDHLDRYSYKNRFGTQTRIYHPYMDDEPLHTDEVLIGEIPIQEGDTMMYLFDFGDNWEFDVELERIDPRDEKKKEPVVVESRGEAPRQYPIWGE